MELSSLRTSKYPNHYFGDLGLESLDLKLAIRLKGRIFQEIKSQTLKNRRMVNLPGSLDFILQIFFLMLLSYCLKQRHVRRRKHFKFRNKNITNLHHVCCRGIYEIN